MFFANVGPSPLTYVNRCGGIEIYTNGVDTTLHGAVETLLKQRLVYIVLILPHSYALGVYLHQFGQWIHEASAYAHSATHSHILIGELIPSHL